MDRIEKEIELRASIEQVWSAIADHNRFGTWFRVKLDSPFVVGQISHGQITYPGYEHLTMQMQVEAMDAPTRFAYRWHPNASDSTADYSQEPSTLVEFLLTAIESGTRLKICESGFDQLPLGRRDESFRVNSQGWDIQMVHLHDYLNL